MIRRYLALSIVACVTYSLVAPLVAIGMAELPSTTAVFLSNFVMLVAIGGLIVIRRLPLRPYLRHQYTPHIVLMGLLLTIGLLSYYRAIELGPVSVVVPIFGLFIVISSFVGILAFEERVTPRKVAAIGLSVVAIVLIAI